MSAPSFPPPLAPPSECITEHVYSELSQAFGSGNLTGDFTTTPLLSIALPVVLIPVSLFLLVVGGRFVKASFTTLGLGAGAVVSLYVIHGTGKFDLPCEIAVTVVLAVGLICALVAACLVRLATFLLGFVCGGVIVFSVFAAAPSLATSFTLDTPSFLGYTLLPFWAAVGGVGLLFGVVASIYKSYTAIIITAILGGYGMPFAVRVILKGNLPSWAHLAIFAGSALAGAVVQVVVRQRTRAATNRASYRFARTRNRDRQGVPSEGGGVGMMQLVRV